MQPMEIDMKTLIFILLFPIVLFGQVGIMQNLGFTAADSIESITVPDSVEMRIGDGPWKLLTSCVNDTAYVTADDKAAGTTKQFRLAGESYWTYGNSLRFRVYATGVDTVTSKWIGVGSLRGALTLFLRPAASATATTYIKSTVEGN